MSKATQSKLGRMFTGQIVVKKSKAKNGQDVEYRDYVISRNLEVLPEQKREKIKFEYGGVEFEVLVSPGQVINKKRYFKKEMERRNKEWIKKAIG